MTDLPEIPLISVAVLTPTPRIVELFNKPGMLTEDEWAELALYESQQQEERE